MDESYIKFARRWWWLVVSGSIVALLVTAYSLRNQSVLYTSTATVQVGRTIQDTKPTQSELDVINQLVPAYTEIAKRPPLYEKTIEALGLPLTVSQVQSMTLISQVSHAPLIDITVVDSDPQRAAAISTEIAKQIVAEAPAPSQEDEATQAFIRSQLDDLKKKISDGQSSLQSLQDQIAHLTSASTISDAQRQFDVLNQQVNSWQDAYAQLLQSVGPTNTNMVSLVNPGSIPSSPMARPRMMYYGLGIVIGAGLSVIIALLLDLLWPSIRGPKDLGPIDDGTPVVSVPRFRTSAAEVHVVVAKPSTSAAGAYRQLRNVIKSVPETVLNRIAVVSARSGDGKTTTASNLAISIAASGQNVLLVDANMRNPELAERFDLPCAPGFSDLLRQSTTWPEVVHQSKYRNLKVVTAGRLSADYADLLSSQHLGPVIDQLSAMHDVIVFDCPAVLEENEPLLLLKNVNSVIAVVDLGSTKSGIFESLLETLKASGVNVMAVVGNKAPRDVWNGIAMPWSKPRRRRREADERRLRHTEGFEAAPVQATSNDVA